VWQIQPTTNNKHNILFPKGALNSNLLPDKVPVLSARPQKCSSACGEHFHYASAAAALLLCHLSPSPCARVPLPTIPAAMTPGKETQMQENRQQQLVSN
jgi:hypothetical protein